MIGKGNGRKLMMIVKCRFFIVAQQNLSLKQSASNMKERTQVDTAWILGGVDCFNNNDSPSKKTPGTWSAFNSLTHRKNENLTNVALLAPLIRSPPTDISTLYTAILKTGAVAEAVIGDGSVAIVTLDLRLYDPAMRLWAVNTEIRNKYVFRPGELHVIFWALAAIGEYIEASGIDLLSRL